MSKSGVELDFFSIEKESSPPNNIFKRKRSFRDIQNVVSKISPEIVRNVMARSSSSIPPTPKHDQTCFPAMPVYVPTSRVGGGSEKGGEIAPLTIFYNGTVAVFDVPRDKAEDILKRAEEVATPPKLGSSSSDKNQMLVTLDGDLPIARKKSLERFLEKRKERLTCVSPYGSGCPSPPNSEFA